MEQNFTSNNNDACVKETQQQQMAREISVALINNLRPHERYECFILITEALAQYHTSEVAIARENSEIAAKTAEALYSQIVYK